MNTENSEARSVFFARKLTLRQFSTRSKFIWGALLIVGLISLGWRLPHLLAKDEPLAPPASRALPVETLQVKALTSYQTSRAYSGQVTARRSSELGFERAGRLTRLDVDDGAQVKLDDALATLDTQELQTTQLDLKAQLAQAAARLAEMRAGPRAETIDAAQAEVQERWAEIDLARSRRARRLRLWKKDVVAREELDTAEAELKTWQARLDASQRRLDELKAGTRREQIQAQEAIVAQLEARLETVAIDLEKSVLKAPFTGTISARLADEGTVVAAGQAILRLVEDSHLEVRVGLPPRVAATLSPGGDYPVQAGSTQYSARVTAILPELDAATRTVTAVLTFSTTNGPPLQPGAVVPGQTVRLKLEETVPTAGFWLPTTALNKGERGLWSCLVVMPDSPQASAGNSTGESGSFHAESRDLEVLHTASSRVFVRGVLQDGERIVKNGTHRLVPGQRVTPIAAK